MSNLEGLEPVCVEQSDSLKLMVEPKSKDLGGFSVRRVLPSQQLRKVGPFVFFDEMGPAQFPPGEGINVRPHPHIGLSTVTFLFEGEILHRDSLGFVQPIRPGAVNLMTAGRGIVHSERTSDELLENGQKLHGIQVWMALPDHRQEIEPAFRHYPKDQLPVVGEDGVTTTVIIGDYAGQSSPVAVEPKTLYLDQKLTSGATATYKQLDELAVYVIKGKITIGQCEIGQGQMAVFNTAEQPSLTATDHAHLMIIGGEAMSERQLFWNFVHTSAGRIESAKQDWRDEKFESVPDDDERIPLPE